MSIKIRRSTVKFLIISAVAFIVLLSFAAHTGANGTVRASGGKGMVTGRKIYSENFDNVENGKLPEGWKMNADLASGGSAAVNNGELVIDATDVNLGKVLLPEFLSEYGNCTFEADIYFTWTKDANRWMSLVVRQQAEDQDYYQMCVRKTTTASNGVEFAVRSAPGEWNVMNTAPAHINVGLNNPVHIRISVVDDLAYEYVDGKLIIATDSMASLRNYYKSGLLGIQANYSVLKVDNVKVSECTFVDDPETPADEKYMSHKFLVTPVVSQAATISVANSSGAIDRLTSLAQKPEGIILYLDGSGNIVSPDGAVTIGSIEDTTARILRKMIPVYYVRTEDAADALTDYLKSSKLIDCMVISDDPALVQKVRKRNKKVSGAIDFRSVTAEELTQEKLDEIIYTTNMNSAKTALISEDIALKANVEYMQHRLITVWVAETAAENDGAMLHNSIQSGANGIVTDTPEKLIDAYALYRLEPAVLVRNPMVIGHRGLPSSAPENTVESAKEAIAAGVDCIELDVRLSSDGKLYIYHDDNLNTMTTGSGTVGSHTSAELDTYYVTKSSAYGTFSKYKKVKLPSLDDYFAELKDEDVMFFIEIKEANLEKKVAELVEKYGLKNRCCMISFVTSAVTAFPSAEPGMSVGQLMGTPAGATYETKVNSIIATVVPENATFNASGVNDIKMIRALMYRGVTCWPWTYNNATTRDAYLLGVGGITTDFCNTVSNVPVSIDIGDERTFTLNPGNKETSSLTFSPAVYSRMGKVDLTAKYADGKPVSVPEIVVIEGAEHVKIEGNTVTALSDGQVRLMYRLLASTDPDKVPDSLAADSFAIYTQVITVNIDSGADVDPEKLPTPTPAGEKTANRSAVKIAVICGISAFVIALCCILLAISGKKKNARGEQ